MELGGFVGEIEYRGEIIDEIEEIEHGGEIIDKFLSLILAEGIVPFGARTTFGERQIPGVMR